MIWPIKKLIKPIYSWLIRIGWIRTETDKYQDNMLNAYATFSKMSKLSGIKFISFNEDKCVIVLCDGRRYIFNPFIRASQLYSIPKDGTFEEKETKYLSKLIKTGDVCVDIGASFGWYTILFSKLVGNKGHVYAFEPLPENYSVLENNIKENQLNNITTFSIALGDTKKTTKLYLPDIGVSGSLQLHEYRNNYDEIKCEIDTFDSIAEKEKIKRIDFIKADIEGGELAFLNGAINSIRTHMPILMLEIQEKSTNLFDYKPDDVFKFLENLNYKAYYIIEGSIENPKLRLVDRSSNKYPDYNFLFIPDNRREMI